MSKIQKLLFEEKSLQDKLNKNFSVYQQNLNERLSRIANFKT